MYQVPLLIDFNNYLLLVINEYSLVIELNREIYLEAYLFYDSINLINSYLDIDYTYLLKDERSTQLLCN